MDLELTCYDNEYEQDKQREPIQIGIYGINYQTKQEHLKYSSYIRFDKSYLGSYISDRCEKITGITEKFLFDSKNKSRCVPIERLNEKLLSMKLSKSSLIYCWGSDGKFLKDYYDKFYPDLEFPFEINNFVNLAMVYRTMFGLSIRPSLSDSLDKLSGGKYDGAGLIEHDALSDAIMTSHLFFMMQDKLKE
jgi:inhibitor of KinA sporulation pathway (predicted exonuclease)